MNRLGLLGIGALALGSAWCCNRPEIRIVDTKGNPDGRRAAVVQMEVYNPALFVNVAVHAVRLKGPAQKDRQGDLVMNVQVNYPDPAPAIAWSDGSLVVTLAKDQKYQYFATPVSGGAVTVQQK